MQEELLGSYFLKGGVVLELRFAARARATKDLDLGLEGPRGSRLDLFRRALALGFDAFTFRLKAQTRDMEQVDTVRVNVAVAYRTRAWLTIEMISAQPVGNWSIWWIRKSRALETHGTAVPILHEVAYNDMGAAQWDVSPAPSGHGTAVYLKSSNRAPVMATLQWVDATGRKEPLAAKAGAYQSVNLSPEGKRAALVLGEGSTDLWVYDLQRDAITRLTFGGSD